MLIKLDTYGPQDHGYFLIDQRASGELPPGCSTPIFEAQTYTCHHCECVVVMNPARKRERYKCRACAKHVCDPCAGKLALGEPCYPFKRFAEDSLEALSKQAERPAEIPLNPPPAI